jgi:hypothetical protein
MKQCSKCKQTKEPEMFYKNRSSLDGLRTNCKSCSKQYREDTKEHQKEYRDKNKEKNSRMWKERYYDDKSPKQEKNKSYYEKNKEKIKLKSKEYYENNSEKKKSYQRDYQKNNKEKHNIYLRERRQNDENFRLVTNIRNLILNSFLNMGYRKDTRTQEILGCSYEDFKKYLESKFEPWMSWENRGLYNGEEKYGWDIDHIFPVSKAKNKEDIINLNHYTNLQPLCSKTNRDIKRNKIWQEATIL